MELLIIIVIIEPGLIARFCRHRFLFPYFDFQVMFGRVAFRLLTFDTVTCDVQHCLF